MHARIERIGILSGGGSVPLEIADSARRRGHEVHIVALDGEADADFGTHKVTTVNWGQVGTMVRTLKEARVDALVIVGRVHRPELWKLRTDLGFFLNLPSLLKIVASGGDDSVLRRVIRFFEAQGIRVIGPADAAPEIVIGEGPLGDAAPSLADAADIAKGFAVVRALGPYDVGQGVVIADGVIEAIEGAEGTDRMLERTARQRNESTGRRRGVLVKRSKPGQDLRVDMPAIGPKTMARVAAAGLDGIAVEAGKVLVAQRAAAIARANAEKVFVAGVRDEAGASAAGDDDRFPAAAFKRHGRVEPTSHVLADARRGAAVLKTLKPYAPAGGAAVVVRNHVLAVEAGEGAIATVERAANLKQWESLTRGRRGIAIIAQAEDLTLELVGAIDRAGYAGLVVTEEVQNTPETREAIAAADAAKICVLAETGTKEHAGMDASKTDASDVRLVLIAGEHSGDALGGKLMAALKAKIGSRVKFQGVGDEHMAREGLVSDFPMSDVAVMGPLAILRHLPRILNRVYGTVDRAIAAEPDAVVIIDSPEFTHPIAKRIRKRCPDIPIIDYVSPSVWAWRPGRAKKMRPYVDHILGLLPFEPEAHERLGGPPCSYVGHPLIERLDWLRSLDPEPLRVRLGLDPSRPVVVALPGSRSSEVGRLMEPFGDTLRVLTDHGIVPEVVIPCVAHVREQIERLCTGWPVAAHLVEGEENKFRAFRLAHAALAASGTVTLELALAGTPMVVAYRVDPVAAPFLRRLIKAPTTVLANLVLGRNAFPEFHQEQSSPENLARALEPLLSDTAERRAQLAALAEIPERMHIPCGRTPSEAAADIVIDYALKRKGRG